MSHNKNATAFVMSVIMLSGCSIMASKKISPPSDTEWVNVTIKNPSRYTKPFIPRARYISYTCQKTRISGFDGSLVTEPSYSVINIPLQQQENDLWRGKVAMSGGGWCDWKLSQITLGIEYTDATHLREDLVSGTGVGAKIAFDGDASRNGQYTIYHGDLYLSPNYYPYIREKKWVR